MVQHVHNFHGVKDTVLEVTRSHEKSVQALVASQPWLGLFEISYICGKLHLKTGYLSIIYVWLDHIIHYHTHGSNLRLVISCSFYNRRSWLSLVKNHAMNVAQRWTPERPAFQAPMIRVRKLKGMACHPSWVNQMFFSSIGFVEKHVSTMRLYEIMLQLC